MPGSFSTRRPTPQHRTVCFQSAFFHNLAVGRLYAKTDSFLVYVESYIVNSIHGVLLIEISESAASNSRSQQCNLEENPFSLGNNPFFQHLYIQTDGQYVGEVVIGDAGRGDAGQTKRLHSS